MSVASPSEEPPPPCESVDDLMVALQTELRAIAVRRLAGERPGHTLQPTALVNEAYLRLLDQQNLHGATRAAFLAAAAQTVRRILVDHARERGAAKRGGDRVRVTLTGIDPAAKGLQLDVLTLDEALLKLRGHNERIYQVVSLRFFSAMTQDEVAEALGIAPRTVAGDWAFAKAWLKRELAQ
jgi:RNA polymerase sigma-70 factor (ECF subfamily)